MTLSPLAELLRLSGWSGSAGEERDWPSVERVLGHPLPSDYRSLVETFPEGLFGSYLSVAHPRPGARLLGDFAYFEFHLEEVRKSLEFPFGVHPDVPGLVPWASTADAVLVFWLSGGVPDDWPTVVLDQELQRYETFALPATEFILRLVTHTLESEILDLSRRGPVFKPFT